MLLVNHRARRVLPVVVALGMTFAIPALAAPQGGRAAVKTKADRSDEVETRIKTLHSQLHITQAQEPAWNDVAQVMRDNAARVKEMRRQNDPSATAVDTLNAYASVIDAHADGLHRLVPAFQKLYDTMSDQQKKTADAVFRERAHAAAQRHRP